MSEQATEHALPSARALLLNFVALMALGALSLVLSFARLGDAGYVVALVIAVVKAALVALIFMELIVARFTVRIVLVTAVGFVCLLIAFMLTDVLLRTVPPLNPPTLT
jgi:cytochrome c oxidase subunit 4